MARCCTDSPVPLFLNFHKSITSLPWTALPATMSGPTLVYVLRTKWSGASYLLYSRSEIVLTKVKSQALYPLGSRTSWCRLQERKCISQFHHGNWGCMCPGVRLTAQRKRNRKRAKHQYWIRPFFSGSEFSNIGVRGWVHVPQRRYCTLHFQNGTFRVSTLFSVVVCKNASRLDKSQRSTTVVSRVGSGVVLHIKLHNQLVPTTLKVSRKVGGSRLHFLVDCIPNVSVL